MMTVYLLVLVAVVLTHAQVTEFPKRVEPEEPFENSNPREVNGRELYQSDILLTDEQINILKDRKARADLAYRWTEGEDGYPVVPYTFIDMFSADEHTIIQASLDSWMEHTCIRFVETTNFTKPYVKFYNGTGTGSNGCWARLGMIYHWTEGQELNLGPRCVTFGTVVHEVGHTIGLYHEQSRWDRDGYVYIVTENIESGYESQFDKGTDKDNNYTVPYDYSSIMHYGTSFFTIKDGKPTIVTKDPLAQGLIGSRVGLSHRDKLLANRMYSCIDKWLVKCGLSSDPCVNDGYTGVNCTCVCPPGINGATCETIVADYYAHVHHPATEKITNDTSMEPVTVSEAGERFTKYIVPTECQKATVTFTAFDMEDYTDCQFQYLSISTSPPYKESNIYCANQIAVGQSFSSDNGIVLYGYNNVNYGGGVKTIWTADVKFEDIPGCGDAGGSIETVGCSSETTIKTLEDGESVRITSPTVREAYPSQNITCSWKMQVQRNNCIQKVTKEGFISVKL